MNLKKETVNPNQKPANDKVFEYFTTKREIDNQLAKLFEQNDGCGCDSQ